LLEPSAVSGRTLNATGLELAVNAGMSPVYNVHVPCLATKVLSPLYPL
jgi:hypothetical protein